MVLAGRDGERAREARRDEHGMEYRVFGLDDRDEVRRGLRDVDVVINAAGPFAWTAERLVKARSTRAATTWTSTARSTSTGGSTISGAMPRSGSSPWSAAPGTRPPRRICCWTPRFASFPTKESSGRTATAGFGAYRNVSHRQLHPRQR